MFALSTQLGIYLAGLLIVWFVVFRLRTVRSRQILFLGISYLFYATWGPWFLGILIFSSLMNYGLGIVLRRRASVERLWLGIALNVALLSTFKYLPLLGRVAPGTAFASLAHIVLPVGISFWTFQALSYLFDLYREEELDPSLLEFCLYMAFWPTVLSGPICRMGRMLPQFRAFATPCWDDLATGTRRIVTGLGMVLLSQVLAAGIYPGKGVDAAFSLPAERLSGLDVWMLIIAYGFQMFFNFCGYSHLVIGAARLFGFELHENFNRPYLSTSASEFWTRWHMSLSFWIRDYMFFPLATLRRGAWWRNLCLVIAMFVFGLWHKGSFLFMLWGTYHGLLLVVHRQWQQLRLRARLRLPSFLSKPASWGLTFTAISLSWIFFRASNMHQAATMLGSAFSPRHFFRSHLPLSLYGLTLVLGVGYFLVVVAAQILDRWELAYAERAWSRHLVQNLLQNRWVWIAPASFVVSLYFFLLLRPTVHAAAPMLYRLF